MPWYSSGSSKRWYNRPLIWFSMIALIVGVWLANIKAREIYHVWKEKRLIKEARAFFDAGDYRSAALNAQRVLQMNSSNLDASRIMAEVLETARMRESILWRRRLTELNPDDPQHRIAWASSALNFGEASMAVQALGSFNEAMRKTAAYHSLAASVAMAQGKVAMAEAHYTEALRLETGRPQRVLDLANVQLQSSDPKIRQSAEATIESFLPQDEWRVQARRMLTVEAARTGRMEQAMEMSKKLQADPKALFSDQLIHLNLLHLASSPRFAITLQSLQRRAKDRPDELFDLISWMNANNSALLALNWSKELPKEVRSAPPVPLAVGESYATLADWPGLKTYTAGGAWEVIEFGRCALLSLAYRKLGDDLNSKTQWINAMRAAQKRPDALIALARLSSAWGWENETEDLLWQIAGGTFPPEWVFGALHKIYAQRRDSHAIYRLLKRELALNPKDPQAENRVVYSSLLLGDNVEKAAKTSAELYKKHPDDLPIATAYAFALHLQKRNKEALDIMRKLKDSQLRDPDIAVYYALMLTSAGETDKAREFFKLGEKSALLPEEKTMVEQAQALLNAP